MSMYIGGDKIDGLYVKKTLSPGDAISYNDLTDKPFIPTAVTDLSDASNYALKTDIQTYTAGTGIDITNGIISNTQTSAEWGNITGVLSTQSDLQSALDSKIDGSSLATVATSGDYDDLVNKPTMPNVDQTYNGTSANAQSGVAIAGAKFIQNNSNYLGVMILGTDNSSGSNTNIAIGYSSSVNGANSNIAIGSMSSATEGGVAIGNSATVSGHWNIAIGNGANATSGIQIGPGTATGNSLWIGGLGHYSRNYKLLDSDGKIPDDRLNTTIARTSQLPDLTSYVTTNTAQNITNDKTYVGAHNWYKSSANNTIYGHIGQSVSNTNLDISLWNVDHYGPGIEITNSAIFINKGFNTDDIILEIPTPTEDTTSSTQADTVGARNTKLQDYYTKAEVDAMIGNIEAILQRLNSGNNS